MRFDSIGTWRLLYCAFDFEPFCKRRKKNYFYFSWLAIGFNFIFYFFGASFSRQFFFSCLRFTPLSLQVPLIFILLSFRLKQEIFTFKSQDVIIKYHFFFRRWRMENKVNGNSNAKMQFVVGWYKGFVFWSKQLFTKEMDYFEKIQAGNSSKSGKESFVV